ncbi:Endoglucanase precursor [compost metagenome]
MTYDIGITKEEAPNLKVYAASPDADHGLSQELDYDWDGGQLRIELPALQYWTMIYIDKTPETAEVQQIFRGGGPDLPSPTPAATAAPTQAAVSVPGLSGTAAGVPAATPAPAAGGQMALLLKAEDLSKGGEGKVTIAIDEEKYNQITIPVSVVEGLNGKSLLIQGRGFTLNFMYDNFQQLLEQNKGALTAGAQIQITFKRIEPNDVLLPGTRPWVPAGSTYEFEFGVTAAEGLSRLASFRSPVELSLKVEDKGELNDLLGIYSFIEPLKKWEYAGGRIDTAKQTISAELSHFSRYAVWAYDKTYADVPADHWAYNAIHILTAKHVIQGMTENTFVPSEKVTRAQFAALLAKALHLTDGGPAPFADVAADRWYSGKVAAAYTAGLITGRSGEQFAPNEAITRQEMAVMLAKASAIAGGTGRAEHVSLAFRDRQRIAAWAQAAVETVSAAGLMNGYADGTFAPAHNATRAEAAQAIAHLMKRSNN